MFQLYTALTEADLGERLASRTPSPEAIQLLRRGHADMAKLVERDPGNPTQVIELLKIQRMLIDSLSRVGQRREALSLAGDLIGKARGVASKGGPREEMQRRELPRAFAAMGNVCRLSGRRDESRQWYRNAVTEWDALKAAGVLSPESASELAEVKKWLE